jgi:hypothetical protein
MFSRAAKVEKTTWALAPEGMLDRETDLFGGSTCSVVPSLLATHCPLHWATRGRAACRETAGDMLMKEIQP